MSLQLRVIVYIKLQIEQLNAKHTLYGKVCWKNKGKLEIEN
jgi:hypothetical protein